jgi:hypothetical protein
MCVHVVVTKQMVSINVINLRAAARRWQDEVSKQSVSCFGQLSIRSRKEGRPIACSTKPKGKKLGDLQPLIRVLITGHASKLRLAVINKVLSQKNGHPDG